MPIVRVQAKSFNTWSAAPPHTISFDSLPSAGNTVVVMCFHWRSSLIYATGSVTDNQSNTYTRAATAQGNSASASAIYYCLSIGSPSGTFTVSIGPNGSGTMYGAAVILEFSGVSTLEGVNTATGSSTTPAVTRNVATASGLTVAALVHPTTLSSLAVETLSPAWQQEVEQLNAASYQGGECDSRIVDLSTGDFTANWTANASAAWGAAIAMFTAAADAGQPLTKRHGGVLYTGGAMPLGYRRW